MYMLIKICSPVETTILMVSDFNYCLQFPQIRNNVKIKFSIMYLHWNINTDNSAETLAGSILDKLNVLVSD